MDLISTFQKFTNEVVMFNDELRGLADSIKQLPFQPVQIPVGPAVDLSEIIANVVGAIEPIAFSLAAFFFMLGFLKKTMMFEFVTMENVVKCLLRLVVAKIVIGSSLFLVEQFAYVSNDLIDVVTSKVVGVPNYDAIGAAQADALQQVVDFIAVGLIAKIVQIIFLFPEWLVIQVCKIIIFVQLWGRFLLICLYAMVSPLPFAGIVTEETSGITKTFVQNYAAVLLQGLMMLLILHIYLAFNAIFTSWIRLNGTHIQVAVSIMLVFMLAKSGDMAKRIMGL